MQRLGPDDHVQPGTAGGPKTEETSLESPRAGAKPMSLLAPYTEGGRVDGFIDDLISVFLDSPENLVRYTQTVPLAMHVTSRPHAGDSVESITRRPILSQSKLEAEGSPAEIQIVLGWTIDTRRMLVSLPDDEYKAWTADLRSLLRDCKSCPRTTVETLVCRLNHTSLVMPDSRQFLSRIRAAAGPEGKRQHTVKIDDEVRKDMLLWEDFLSTAHRGLSINLLVTRRPDRIEWSDGDPSRQTCH